MSNPDDFSDVVIDGDKIHVRTVYEYLIKRLVSKIGILHETMPIPFVSGYLKAISELLNILEKLEASNMIRIQKMRGEL
jgi:hypothetical protein